MNYKELHIHLNMITIVFTVKVLYNYANEGVCKNYGRMGYHIQNTSIQAVFQRIRSLSQKKIIIKTEILQIFNTLNKIYISAVEAWIRGKHLIMQPSFDKSYTKFNWNKIVSLKAIAVDTLGIERAVRLSTQIVVIKEDYIQMEIQFV